MGSLYIAQVVNHPSKVIEIQMKKPGFHHEAGQVSHLVYLFLFYFLTSYSFTFYVLLLNII